MVIVKNKTVYYNYLMIIVIYDHYQYLFTMIIWVNYNNSLTWIKAIWGWFP